MSPRIGRLGLSALLAYSIAVLLSNSLFFLLWPALYLGWHYLGRYRAAHGLRTFLWNAGAKSPASQKRSRLRRVSRAIGETMAALIVASLVLSFASCEFNRRKAAAVRATIQEGMTLGEVLHSIRRDVFLSAHSEAPWVDPENPPTAILNVKPESQEFHYHGRALSESEALAVLHRRLVDGYRWRIEFFFPGFARFSFTVVFNKDGRVREVTPLHGSGPH